MPTVITQIKNKNNSILKLNCSTKYNIHYIAINTSIVSDPLQKHGQKTDTCGLNAITPSLNLIHSLTRDVYIHIMILLQSKGQNMDMWSKEGGKLSDPSWNNMESWLSSEWNSCRLISPPQIISIAIWVLLLLFYFTFVKQHILPKIKSLSKLIFN